MTKYSFLPLFMKPIRFMHLISDYFVSTDTLP